VKLLLDTHTMFWWLPEETRPSPTAKSAIELVGSETHVSVASAWEMAVKVGNGKWPGASGLLDDLGGLLQAERFRLSPITLAHVRAAGLMTVPHRDPFERFLAAQAQIEGLTIVTIDRQQQALGAPWLW
jgi:PIN domain nuclease of toxin-antitoxin system